MKNKDWGRGKGRVGLNREGVLINFPPLKRGGLLERGGAYLRGGLNRGFTVLYLVGREEIVTVLVQGDIFDHRLKICSFFLYSKKYLAC